MACGVGPVLLFRTPPAPPAAVPQCQNKWDIAGTNLVYYSGMGFNDEVRRRGLIGLTGVAGVVGVAYPYSGNGTLHSHHMTAFTVPLLQGC